MPLSMALLVAAMAGTAAHSQPVDTPDCFDALVVAKVVKQSPSPIPDCPNDCIVMRWPWFLDLEVKRSLAGEVPVGRLGVLSVQHTEFRPDYGFRRWWLRRNSEGGFNLLGEAGHSDLARCPKGTPAADAYIKPAPGETIEQLRIRSAKEDRPN